MSIISLPFTFSAGAVIIASQHNTNFSTIYSDYNGGITNANIDPLAAIAYSKLTLTGSIVNADINASAAIAGSKLNLVSPGAIGTTTPAAGKFTTLEATSTLKLGTTNQGDIIYDNGTSLVRLPPGTSGQSLKTQGASANPVWGNGGSLVFTSKTTVSTSDTTGSIAITNTKYYKVVFHLGALNADDTLVLLFNTDGSSVYNYAFDGRTTGGAITGGAASAAQINLGTASDSAAGNFVDGEFFIYPQSGTALININGKVTYINAASSLHTYVDFSGSWTGSAATNFSITRLVGGTTFSGTVLLYELLQA